MPDDWVSVGQGGGDWVPVAPAATKKPAAQPQQQQKPDEGVFHRLWEGIKAGWSDKQFERPSDIPGGAVGAVGALPSRMLHNALGGIVESVEMPGRVASGEQPITGTAADARLGIPTASLLVGGGTRFPKTTIAEPGRGIAGLWEDIKSGVPGSLQSRAGNLDIGPAGGGRIEPLPAQPAPVQTGPQPPRLTGQPLPEPQAGVPAAPGGMVRPPLARVVPGQTGGLQPPRPQGSAGIPGPMREAEPAAPGGATAEEPSSLATAISRNDMSAVDRQLAKDYRRVVQPRLGRDPSEPRMTRQDRRMVTAIDDIAANAKDLRLTSEGGFPMPPGSTPKTLRQFSEAISQSESAVFAEYDLAARQAGKAGIHIDLQPIAARLREMADDPVLRVNFPAASKGALERAMALEAQGTFTPLEAQSTIQLLNRTLGNDRNLSVAEAHTIGPEAEMLRDALDKAITGATGSKYAALKNRYGSLKSIRNDVARAVYRDRDRFPAGIGDMLINVGATEQLLHGVIGAVTGHGAAGIGRAATIQAARFLQKYINSPNRAVARMFQHRANLGRASAPLRVRDVAGRAGFSVPRAAAGYGAGNTQPRSRQTLEMVQPSPYGAP